MPRPTRSNSSVPNASSSRRTHRVSAGCVRWSRSAAERLHLTQPALTRCVRRLEEAFGTELFERVGRGIRLTQAGEELLSRARRLHVAADETTRAMQDFAQ